MSSTPSAFVPDYVCRSKRGKATQPACDNFCMRVLNCITGWWIVQWLKIVEKSGLKIWFDKKTNFIYLDEDRPSTPNMVKVTVKNCNFDNTKPTTWTNQPTHTQWRNLDQLHGQIIILQFISELPSSGEPEKLYYVSEDGSLRIWDTFKGVYSIFKRTTT